MRIAPKHIATTPSQRGPMSRWLIGASAIALFSLASAQMPAYAQSDDTTVEVKGAASAVVGIVDGETKADADIRIGVTASRVLQNGLEIGGTLEARADGQQPQSYFNGGRYSSMLGGGARGVVPEQGDAYLQSAFAYARGGFGFVSLGRDNGVASQLAVTAPTVFSAIGVNDWKTDLSELNDVHTINDFSGYATKLTYMAPANLFGGVLGGVQLGVSYAPELEKCGDTNCAPIEGFSPDAIVGSFPGAESRWENVVETALYYEKALGTSADSPRLGVGASYMRADEAAIDPDNILDDYSAYSLGLNLAYRGVTVGGSVKNSNAGLAAPDSDYLAFDAGITYETGAWGFMFGYGNGDAGRDAAGLFDPDFYRETQSAQAGVSYALGRGVTLGAAAQFVDSQKPEALGGKENVASVLFESSIKF